MNIVNCYISTVYIWHWLNFLAVHVVSDMR